VTSWALARHCLDEEHSRIVQGDSAALFVAGGGDTDRHQGEVLNRSGEAAGKAPQNGDCHQFPPLELVGCTRFAYA
jgi:hypothetical protein